MLATSWPTNETASQARSWNTSSKRQGMDETLSCKAMQGSGEELFPFVHGEAEPLFHEQFMASRWW